MNKNYRSLGYALLLILGFGFRAAAEESLVGAWEGKVTFPSGGSHTVRLDIRDTLSTSVNPKYYLVLATIEKWGTSVPMTYTYSTSGSISLTFAEERTLKAPSDVLAADQFPVMLNLAGGLAGAPGTVLKAWNGQSRLVFRDKYNRQAIINGTFEVTRVAQTGTTWHGAIDMPTDSQNFAGDVSDYVFARYSDGRVIAASTKNSHGTAKVILGSGIEKDQKIVIGGPDAQGNLERNETPTCLVGKFSGTVFEGEAYKKPHTYRECTLEDIKGKSLGQFTAKLFPAG